MRVSSSAWDDARFRGLSPTGDSALVTSNSSSNKRFYSFTPTNFCDLFWNPCTNLGYSLAGRRALRFHPAYGSVDTRPVHCTLGTGLITSRFSGVTPSSSDKTVAARASSIPCIHWWREEQNCSNEKKYERGLEAHFATEEEVDVNGRLHEEFRSSSLGLYRTATEYFSGRERSWDVPSMKGVRVIRNPRDAAPYPSWGCFEAQTYLPRWHCAIASSVALSAVNVDIFVYHWNVVYLIHLSNEVRWPTSIKKDVSASDANLKSKSQTPTHR